ncbi:MAG: hypothetical protein K0S98_2228 [Propionibacteriaceae bacterium]|nr:hypothetical protein [Propionibacteriaceae bacterium]
MGRAPMAGDEGPWTTCPSAVVMAGEAIKSGG